LGKSDEYPFWSTYVAESIHVLIIHHLAYELSTKRANPFQSVIDVVDREHGAEIP